MMMMMMKTFSKSGALHSQAVYVCEKYTVNVTFFQNMIEPALLVLSNTAT